MPEERICSECGAKISPDTQGGLCVRCLFNLGLKTGAGTEVPSPAAPVAPITEKPGDRIGRYKLLQKLGEGGCGVVYMAEQEEPVRRRVALKVIKLGMDTREVITRFEAERQALAMMDHPNIAKVHDGGATGTGRPYFVMELVRGVRITEYCDQHNLPTRERLDLFIMVCQAIQHAHQKGIIHRDIKPSNILVTVNDGVPVPKVIDFGIAKATEGRLTEKTLFTAFQQFMGTPAYMSPEQAEMTSLDIDTRSDIYSLGVLLYELLTGKTPFDAKELREVGFDAMRRAIREQEPAKPSTCLSTMAGDDLTTVAKQRQADPPKLISLVRGDLDWIVMKCLEKDRTRRYEAANGLAADIQRHLNNEPVLASPPSNLYRLHKTMRRHKLAFAASGAVLASLVIGLGATAVMFFKEQVARSEVARKSTELELKKAEVERKNTEFRAMLGEAARSDCFAAKEKLRLVEQEQAAFAHLARACQYDPSSTLASEMAVAALGGWNHELPNAILVGHTKRVRSAQFSPDGTHVVTASFDKTACVWDVATGQILVTLAGHTGEVSSAEFSPDGQRIVTASYENTARVWDTSTGKTLATLTGHEKPVLSAHFSPDGKRILTVSVDKTARVWDARSGNGLVVLGGYTNMCITAQFSPDGTRIVTAGDRTALVWDVVTGKTIARLAGHTHGLRGAWFSHDGTRIVTASADKTARVWDVPSGKALVTLTGHEAWVESAQFSPDGTRIVTAGRDDMSVRIWDAGTGKLLRTLAGHEGEVHSAQFSPAGDRIVSVSWSKADSNARLWDAYTGELLAMLAGHQAGVWTAQFSPDGTHIVTASDDKTARVWDAATMKAMLAKSSGFVEFSPDGKRIVTESRVNNTAPRVLDATTGKTLATLGDRGRGWGAKFSPDGTRVATASDDKTVRVWDTATGNALVTLAGHTGVVWGVQFSPDGTRIATASEGDKTVRVWDTATGKALATFAHTRVGNSAQFAQFSVDGTRIVTMDLAPSRLWDSATGKMLAKLGDRTCMALPQFSPDGRRIITISISRGSSTKSTFSSGNLWDAATGEMLATFRGWVSAQFSPDGRSIITTSGSSVADLWDTASGKALTKLAGHEGRVASAQFSPDGTRIATASVDKTVRVWDAATGKPLATLGGREALQFAKFTSDGTRIITTSIDLSVRVWDVLQEGAGPPPEWFPDFLRCMAQMRLNPDGELETLKPADWLALRERLRGVLRASVGADTPYLRVLRKYVRE